MHNKLLLLIYSSLFVFVLLVISCIFIKFDYSQLCPVLSSDSSYTIVLNKKENKFVKKHNIKKITSEIDNKLLTFNLYYNTYTQDNYCYWLNPTSDSFVLEQGNYNFCFNFGKINFISYIF